MSLKIIWYTEALEELEQIYNSYFQKNPNAAVRIYNSILQEIKLLKDHPNIAAIEHYLQDIERFENEGPFRSLVTKDGLFKVIYYLDNNDIIISRIWACRQNPKKLKNK